MILFMSPFVKFLDLYHSHGKLHDVIESYLFTLGVSYVEQQGTVDLSLQIQKEIKNAVYKFITLEERNRISIRSDFIGYTSIILSSSNLLNSSNHTKSIEKLSNKICVSILDPLIDMARELDKNTMLNKVQYEVKSR